VRPWDEFFDFAEVDVSFEVDVSLDVRSFFFISFFVAQYEVSIFEGFKVFDFFILRIVECEAVSCDS